jgi:hypothetical protein
MLLGQVVVTENGHRWTVHEPARWTGGLGRRRRIRSSLRLIRARNRRPDGLHLLMATGGRERSAEQFKQLFSAAGLQLQGVRAIAALPSILVE